MWFGDGAFTEGEEQLSLRKMVVALISEEGGGKGKI